MTNGSALLADLDGRTAPVRRYRDLYQQFVQDIGGDPSAAQDAIARRAAQLCVVLEQSEATYLAGGGVNIAEYTTASNAMRRLLADLGIERVPRDVTPSLASYVASRASAATSDSFKPSAATRQPANTGLTSEPLKPAEGHSHPTHPNREEAL
ncbi:hypothetical protein [Bradyrhizobium genomosp. III]|uniref:hypothetical protein n=1 Tax=Bradyrhizobium genomosp. III TaxID=2683271 RepID=UPI0004BAB42C|nr:hypothetical protein [Bradyrhizobium sp. CCBAU 15544]